MSAVVRVMALLAALTSVLGGCMAALAIPAAGIINNVHKSGVMEIVVEGPGNAVSAFKDAAISTGGVVPQSSADFARAEFSNSDVKVDAQLLPKGQMRIRGGPLSDAGRTYQFEDGIGNVTQAIVDGMVAKGFKVVSSERKRLTS